MKLRIDEYLYYKYDMEGYIKQTPYYIWNTKTNFIQMLNEPSEDKIHQKQSKN